MTAPIRDTDTQSAAERLEILKAGWRAMAMLERHAQERSGIPVLDAHACAPCMRYGVAVGLRGGKPSEVLHLRCEEAQGWQRQVEAVNRLVFGDAGVPCCDMHNQHCEPPSELCCRHCTESAHDTFPTPHADGSRCVLATTKETR